jgi:hypothetical protein
MNAIDKVVAIKCEGSTTVDIKEVHEFQGDFKALTKENFEKLKKTILIEGFADPLNIWINPEDRRKYLLS